MKSSFTETLETAATYPDGIRKKATFHALKCVNRLCRIMFETELMPLYAESLLSCQSCLHSSSCIVFTGPDSTAHTIHIRVYTEAGIRWRSVGIRLKYQFKAPPQITPLQRGCNVAER